MLRPGRFTTEKRYAVSIVWDADWAPGLGWKGFCKVKVKVKLTLEQTTKAQRGGVS